MKNKPPYAIESVDNALRILQMLRDSGQVRVSDVAAEGERQRNGEPADSAADDDDLHPRSLPIFGTESAPGHKSVHAGHSSVEPICSDVA